MRISSNQFAKKSFTTGSGSFTDFLTPSGNAFIKKQFTLSQTGWEGANTSASAYGTDNIFGGVDSTYGGGVYGGFVHFKLRADYNVTH